MVIFGNMQVLSFLSRFLTTLRYQNGYYGCGGSQRYHYGRCVFLKRSFASTNSRFCLVGLKAKKGEKMKKTCVKKYIFFKMDAILFFRISPYIRFSQSKRCYKKSFSNNNIRIVLFTYHDNSDLICLLIWCLDKF